jgi:hypothetical protein
LKKTRKIIVTHWKNMKKAILLSLLLALQSCMIGAGENSKVEAGKNNYFPKITGIDLDGKKQDLPDVFKNKLNLVIVAFKREQQAEVDTWIKAAEPILKENPNLSFYEIPLIYELSAFKRMWVNNGMRFGIPDEIARKRTITVYTNRQEFFEITQMKEEKIYALLIDSNGKILWRKEGVANDKKMSDLKKIMLTKSKF